MNDSLTNQVENLIMERMGLKLRPRQRDLLQGNLSSRLAFLRLANEYEYCHLLRKSGNVAEDEWQHLARLLTNKESYFFRDKGQIALLRDVILPELIQRNLFKKTIRMWSAGCSTGEEPYTLAMLVDGLLPKSQIGEWRITVVGTDIDGKSLRHARQGIYGSWSFRMVDPTIKQRYFQPQDGKWRVSEPYRSSVTFIESNLVADTFPNREKGLCEIDLILCRNVFIYFGATAVASVLDKFAKTLCDGGYLMTGHVETRDLTRESFDTRSFPGSEIYRKRASVPETPPKQMPTPAAPTLSARQGPLTAASKAKHQASALRDVSNPPLSSVREGELLVRARNFANLGQYADAVECCRLLTAEFPFSPEPYDLLASIALEQGRNEDAKSSLKKALYLSPDMTHLYMELGALYGEEGDVARAEQMRDTALELLRSMPPENTVGFSDGPNARECITYLTEVIGKGA